MKLAVFVVGEYRTFEHVVPTWGFKDVHECDFFISTWDRSIQKRESLNINIDVPVTKDMFEKHLPNAQIKISEVNDQLHNVQKCVYHMKECLKMYQSSNKTYDGILLLRPDLFFCDVDFNGLKKCGEKDFFATSKICLIEKDHPFIDDFIFYGYPESMVRFIDKIYLEKIGGDAHQLYAETLIEIDVYPKLFEFGISNKLYRSNNFGVTDFHIIEENNKIWNNAK